MDEDRRFSGREERRLPIMMEVDLAPVERPSVERRERTYTDNISSHGVRVHSTGPWQRGEQAQITPVKGESSLRGEVVYCQKLGNDRFFVGLKFRQSRVPWSIFHRFNGLVLMDIFCAMRW
jgi:PilZ domain-containing protein